MKLRFLLLALLVSTIGSAEPLIANPAALAADWAGNPEAAFQRMQYDLQALQDSYDSLRAAMGWLAGLAGVGLTVLGFIRLLPGPSQGIANLLYDLWASRRTKAEEKAQEVASKGFYEVAEIMRRFPKDSALGDVIDKFERQLPPDVKEAYKQWERQQRLDRPPTTAEIVHTERLRAKARSASDEPTRPFPDDHPPSAALDPRGT